MKSEREKWKAKGIFKIVRGAEEGEAGRGGRLGRLGGLV